MKNSQKGIIKSRIIIWTTVGLTIIGVVFFATRNLTTNYLPNDHVNTSLEQNVCANGATNPPHCNADLPLSSSVSSPGKMIDGNTYIDSNFGISFNYNNSVAVIQKDNIISLRNNDTKIDNWITIKELTGDSVTDTSGKFGSVTYSVESHEWIVSKSDERTGGMTTPVVASTTYFTNTGNPVFIGSIPTIGWGRYRYIVGLTGHKFLIVDGPDTDVTLSTALSVRLLFF